MNQSNVYRCDNWVVIFFGGNDPHYKVLTGTSGGYLSGSSWRMNSGIVRVEEDDNYFYFFGSSGSCYACGKQSYGLRMSNGYVWEELQRIHGNKVKLIPENTNWIKHDWIIT
jgi:hypothetical protein